METTQKYRQIVRDEIDKLQPFDSVMYSAKFMRALVNDADRLAQLEDGIRALADRMESADIIDGSRSKCARELRALLGEDGQ